MAEAPITIDRQWFDLNAMPDNVDAAAEAWDGLGTAGDEVGADLASAATTAYDTWQGETREAYQEQATDLSSACASMPDPAGQIAAALRNIAADLRAKQAELSAAETGAGSGMPVTVETDRLVFRPETPEQMQQVMYALAQAGEIRTRLNQTLTAEGAAITSAVDLWDKITDQWRRIADGGTEAGFAVPDEAPVGAAITLPDGTVVVNTGGTGNDEVLVTEDPDGSVVVTVNGESTTYPPGTPLVLRTGEGNDYIEAESATTTVAVTGDGNDAIHMRGGGDNTLLTGDGDDGVMVLGNGDNRVSTGGGNDEVDLGASQGVDVSVSGDNIVSTGEGGNRVSINGDGDNVVSTGGHYDSVRDGEEYDDVVIGGDGADHIYTGDGRDYVRGQDGRDVIVGGGDDDEIYGGGHGDHVYGGEGTDYVDAGKGADNVYGGDGMDVLYGMDGNDNLHGDNGSDYLEGARGDDVLDGGNDGTGATSATGGDVLSGGQGDDRMYGRDGDDVVYGGRGTDYANGGDGDDHAYIQDGDTTTETSSERVDIVSHDIVQVADDSTESFRDRMEADLDMLAASPTGQQSLEYLRDHRHGNWLPAENELVLHEYDENNGTAHSGETAFSDDNSTIDINPDYISDSGTGSVNKPPVVTLYHELAHVNSSWDGSHDGGDVPTGPDSDPDPNSDEDDPVRKSERQAVGLPTDGSDYDPLNPRGNLDLDFELTENGLLHELGRPARETYSN